RGHARFRPRPLHLPLDRAGARGHDRIQAEGVRLHASARQAGETVAMTATRVEIVDDHFLFADALGSVIRTLPDYQVVGIGQSGAQAISIARTAQPDVILLDYHLPGYDAAELIPRLRTLSPTVRIVILTSDTSDATLVRGLRSGVDGYLTKERALDDVLDALR